MIQAIRDTFVQLLRAGGPPPDVALTDLDTALDFYAYAVGGVLLQHCGQPHLVREQLANQLFRLLSGQMVLFPSQTSSLPKVSES